MVNHSLSRSRGSSAAFWKKQLQQHRASGLSVAAFCRVRSLGVASFYAWRRRLLDRATSVPASAEVEGKGISWREVSLSIPGPEAVASACSLAAAFFKPLMDLSLPPHLGRTCHGIKDSEWLLIGVSRVRGSP